MIRLKCKISDIPLELKKTIQKSFNDSVVFYLFHEEDSRKFFIVCAFFNVKKNCIHIVDSFLPKNIKKIEESHNQSIFRLLGGATPHHMVVIEQGRRFAVFVEMVGYFYVVDIEKCEIEVYTAEDLFPIRKEEIVISLCPTVFLDKEEEFIYMSLWKQIGNRNIIEIYKVAKDYGSVELLFTDDSSGPHTIRPYKNKLYTSLFYRTLYQFKKNGKVFEMEEVYEYVLKKLFQEYCEIIGEIYTDDAFKKSVEFFFYRANNTYRISPDFDYFLRSSYKTIDFIELCAAKGYCFIGTPGVFLAYDLEQRQLKKYSTTKPTPAHFEIDEEEDVIYVSNHNFGMFYEGNLSMLGPASIDKFKIEVDGLKKIGFFEHKEGYRFTTHVLFTCHGKKYIAAMGQPNRLYFIDAETMELEYFDTIGEDVLKNIDDIQLHMMKIEMEGGIVIKAIQVSESEGVVFLLGEEYIYFYSFLEKKIVDVVAYNDYMKDRGFNLQRKTTHCQLINIF